MQERFELGARVTGGGMGDVYRAVDRLTGDVVAVKRMRSADAAGTQRFLRESQLLEAVSHPSIVRYVAHGIDDGGNAWLAMEWLEGEDLCERLARKLLTSAESLEIGARVAEALGAAHDAGVVHRDVKPSNVFLVDRDPKNVRLLDLGIAKPLRATAITAAGTMLGTIGYLSPEQARGKPVDPRSDVFSLGCLLFECLTGRPAYHAEHAVAVFGKLLTETPPAPSSVDPSFAIYDALLARMLAPLEQRFPDGATAARAIRAFEADASHTRSVPSSKLTHRERRALTVVLARPQTLDPNGATEAQAFDEEKRQRLAHAAAAAHAVCEWLPGGLLLFVWELDPARDQTVRAARFALVLQHEGGHTVALATGLGERNGSNAFGGVIDRAAHLLERADDVAVTLDPASIEILRHRFEIDGSRLGAELARAHEIADRTPFVGRDREMRLITSLLDECVADGTVRAMLVTAEAGAGKSRILRELLRRSAPERVWIARGDPMRPGSPYTMLSQLVRHAAGMSATAADRAAFFGALRSLVSDESALEVLAHIAGFVDRTPSAALRAAQSNPSVMATRVRQAALTLCAAGAGEGLVVMMLEDLHWADAPSLRLFESLVHAVERPIFIVGAARPTFHETFPGIWTSQNVEELRLTGLGRKAAESLARALQPEASSEAIRHAVDRANGSPLWLEELFRRGAGDYSDTPDSLLAVIQTHLAREPSNERLVLRAAAVFGERAWLEGIALLAGQAAPEIERCVAALVQKEWLVQLETSRFVGKREVRFRHGLLRDAAYAALTSEDRKVGHRLAAEWLRAAGECDALSLAEHYERSETPAAAIPHFVVAAHEASIANDLDAALVRAARGIALGAIGSDLHRLLIAEGSALTWRGKVKEAWRSLDRASRETTTAHADPAFVSWAAMTGAMNMDASMTRRAASALESLDPDTCPDDEYQQAASFVITALYWEGERERADAVLEKLALRPDHPDPRARAWNAHSRALRARFSQGNTWLERQACVESERAFQAARDPAGYSHSLNQLVIAELSLDAREEAIAHSARAYAQAQKYSLQLVSAYSSPVTALAMRDPTSAKARIEESVRNALLLGDGIFGAYSLVLTAHVQRILRDPEGAIDTLKKALSQRPPFAVDCACHMQLAGAFLEAGRAEEAAAECMIVVAATQHRHLRGALDLDFLATSAETMLAVGEWDAGRMVLARAQRIMARRADAMDEPARKERFLASTFAHRLQRVAAKMAQ